MATWHIFLGLVSAYVVLSVVWGPLLAKKNVRFVKPTRCTHAGEKDVPYSIYERIHEIQEELLVLGYHFVGYAISDTMLPHTTTQYGLFRNETTKTFAMVTGLVGQVSMTAVYETIYSAYACGGVITVTNAAALAPSQDPQKQEYHFPDVVDVQQLHAMHQWIVQHQAPASNLAFSLPGEELALLHQEGVREITRQEQDGSLYWDHTVGQYRLTWRGAIRFTLRQAFPMRQLHTYLAVLEGKRAIAGMPGLSSTLPSINAANSSPC